MCHICKVMLIFNGIKRYLLCWAPFLLAVVMWVYPQLLWLKTMVIFTLLSCSSSVCSASMLKLSETASMIRHISGLAEHGILLSWSNFIFFTILLPWCEHGITMVLFQGSRCPDFVLFTHTLFYYFLLSSLTLYL